MRKLALILILASALARADFISPLGSAVLSVTQILMNLGRGQQKYIQVEVACQGSNFDTAVGECFRLAINQAVGSVIATQTESSRGRLTRDEIINYSSGFVDKFEIVSRSNDGSREHLTMKVWVAENRLAKRLLSQGFQIISVPGEQLHAQSQTLEDERKTGDRLLEAVLKDYPQRAFDVSADSGKLDLNDLSRRFSLDVKIEIKWNKNFVNAVNDVLNQTYDPLKHQAAYNFMAQKQPTVRVSAVDANGTVIVKNCVNFAVSNVKTGYNLPPRFLLNFAQDRVWMDHQYTLQGVVRMAVNPEILRQTAQIRTEITNEQAC